MDDDARERGRGEDGRGFKFNLGEGGGEIEALLKFRLFSVSPHPSRRQPKRRIDIQISLLPAAALFFPLFAGLLIDLKAAPRSRR